MRLAKVLDSVQYVTDTQGNKKAVLVDLDAWQGVIEFIERHSSAQRNDLSLHDSSSDDEREKVMSREGAAFQRLHPHLKTKYLGKYVAIYQEQVVDSDSNQAELYRRIKQKFPDTFLWIAPVRDSPDEILHFRSPRLVNGSS